MNQNLMEILDDIMPEQYELIVVDDNSSDRTWKLALELSTKYSQLKIIRRTSEQGNQKRFRRFLKFNLICFSGLVLNILTLNLFYNLFEINEYIANIMAIALVTFWNFWFNLKLNWRSTK